jgi:Methylamine utilisation protein MauE
MSDHCPICDSEKEMPAVSSCQHGPDTSKAYLLLAAVIITIAALAFVTSFFTDERTVQNYATFFMGWFFVIFAIFKLVDLRGFAAGFSMYDLLARRSRFYAIAYPFIELGLGIAYLARYLPQWVNLATVILMSLGSAGVINSLRKKQKIHCACLGAWIKLPLGTISLLEDLGMGLMALAMLVLY